MDRSRDRRATDGASNSTASRWESSWSAVSPANARELDDDLNDNPNLAIFRQTDNGLLLRMALFALILDVVDQVDRHARDVNWYTGSRF